MCKTTLVARHPAEKKINLKKTIIALAACILLSGCGVVFTRHIETPGVGDDYFDFNRASATEMVEICDFWGLELDPVVAANIVAYREANGPFSSEDDLAKVPGVTRQLLLQFYPQESGGRLWFDPSSIPSLGAYVPLE